MAKKRSKKRSRKDVETTEFGTDTITDDDHALSLLKFVVTGQRRWEHLQAFVYGCARVTIPARILDEKTRQWCAHTYFLQIRERMELLKILDRNGRLCTPLRIGVDEAGRGPVAGPVMVCAYTTGFDLTRLRHGRIRDSKQIPRRAEREELSSWITNEAGGHTAFEMVTIGPQQIDRINILQATFEGMTLAVQRLCRQLPDHYPCRIFIDGNKVPPALEEWCKATPWRQVLPVIGGDDRVYEISCASILAKVKRDQYMIRMSSEYPEYHWHSNVGYGSCKKHQAAIRKYGLSPLHRRVGFASKFLSNK